jgi:hypothetical protein
MPRGVILLKDAVKREVNRAHNKKLRAWKKRSHTWSAAQMAERVWGEDTPSEPKSSSKEEEEEGK